MRLPAASPGATGHAENIHVSSDGSEIFVTALSEKCLSLDAGWDSVASMGATHPQEGVVQQETERPKGCSSGCFSDCPTCRRLRKAAVQVAVRNGIAATTSHAIAELAQVPPERAAEHYPTAEDCLAAAYDEGALRLRRLCVQTLRGAGTWRERLHATVDVAIDEFRKRPELARFCMVEVSRSDNRVLCASRLAARERFVAILSEECGVEDADLPELRFEMLAGAAHHMVLGQLEGNGDTGSVRERLDQVIELFEPEPRTAGRR
jgi:AcrR family transcriptional regulator